MGCAHTMCILRVRHPMRGLSGKQWLVVDMVVLSDVLGEDGLDRTS